MAGYIYTDPNFSEGADQTIIEAIVAQFRNRDGVKVIGYEPDADFGRLPVEVIGRSKEVKEALLDAAGQAFKLIDIEKFKGRHPHNGDCQSQIMENHLLELEVK